MCICNAPFKTSLIASTDLPGVCVLPFQVPSEQTDLMDQTDFMEQDLA